MRNVFRRCAIAAAIMVAVSGMTLTPDTANARWGGGGWHGGGWRGGGWHGGGWGWGGLGVGVGTGLLLGAAVAAPYYGGYYGYGPYAYDYGGGPYYGSYAGYGGCHIRGRWVRDGYGHRVWRRVRVCY